MVAAGGEADGGGEVEEEEEEETDHAIYSLSESSTLFSTRIFEGFFLFWSYFDPRRGWGWNVTRFGDFA